MNPEEHLKSQKENTKRFDEISKLVLLGEFSQKSGSREILNILIKSHRDFLSFLKTNVPDDTDMHNVAKAFVCLQLGARYLLDANLPETCLVVTEQINNLCERVFNAD